MILISRSKKLIQYVSCFLFYFLLLRKITITTITATTATAAKIRYELTGVVGCSGLGLGSREGVGVKLVSSWDTKKTPPFELNAIFEPSPLKAIPLGSVSSPLTSKLSL